LKPQRIQALTGVRAIAAIMVFLYHNRKYWRADVPDFFLRFLNEFHTGVSVFFVLSGFLIAFTYKDNPLRSKKNYTQYLLIRLIRIFPVYLIILTLKGIDEGFVNSKETFLTYTLLHGFSDKYNLYGLPQGWSLTVELSFYTVAPFIYFYTKKNISKPILYLLAILVLVTLIGYGWHWYNGNPDSFMYPWFFILNTTFPGRFMEFFAGVLLAHHLHTGKGLAWSSIKYKTAIGGLASLLVIYVMSLFEPDIYQHGTDHIAGLLLRNIAFALTVALFLYGLITERTWLQRFLSTKVLVLLGNASFIFYLVHIGYVNGIFRNWHLYPDRNFILLWLVSIAGFLLIEKPLYELLKKRIKRW
jgi:peptidoglycan/LPS O-acetylase OafA/YrhL